MENPQFWWYLPGKVGIFMGYVSFREGISVFFPVLYLSISIYGTRVDGQVEMLANLGSLDYIDINQHPPYFTNLDFPKVRD